MKKKILFVINTLGGAGAEMALLELLEKLEKQLINHIYQQPIKYIFFF